jgi:predicted SprT family Zn-dependent metalloprotease
MNMQVPLPDASTPERAETMKPTKETYERFQRAYEDLNKALFDNSLPNALITFQRRKGSFGYFAGGRFADKDGRRADEIALNPAHFASRTLPEILSTFVHEMAHLWQHHHGKPGRGRYHNREWAEKMKAIGLQPTDTGMEGGQETGETITHLIVPGGAFAKAAEKLIERGFMIPWQEVPEPAATDGAAAGPENEPDKSGKRVKYCCPSCDLKAWAKHEAKLMCAEHMLLMEATA